MKLLLIDAAGPDRAELIACLGQAQLLAGDADLSLAPTPEHGLAMLRAGQHDVVLMNAPAGATPWQALASALHAAAPRSAILVLSALPPDDAVQGLAEGWIHDVVGRRGLSAATLRQAVRFALARQANAAPLAALRARERLRGVIDAVADALLIVDPRDGSCSDANLAFERVFEMPPRAVLGQGLACLQSSRRMHSTEQLLQFIRSQLGQAPAQWVFRRGVADEVWCEIRASAIDGARPNEVLLSVHDTSASVVATQANKRAFADSARAARTRRQFLANMSHEMRTPLNAILNFARLGLEHCPAAPVDRHLGQIGKAAKLMLALVNDVLDLAKIESGKMALDSSAFDLIQVVNDVADTARPGAAAARLALDVTVAPEVARYWVGDVVRLQQILLNLLSNAVKFTQHGGVALELRRSAGALGAAPGIEFSVADSGIGMSADQFARLFQPFEQGDGKASRRVGGTGLGLAISRKLVDAMHGHIDVQSRPDHGSRFTVTLPLPELVLPAGPVHAATLRVVGLDDSARVGCLLALGRQGIVAEVLSPWVAADADIVLLDRAGPHAEPGGLAAALQAIPSGSLVGLLGANAAPAGTELLARDRCFDLPGLSDAGYARLARALQNRGAGRGAGAATRVDGLRVLVAEDNPVNQLIVEEVLRQRGCTVTLANDGAQAVAAVLSGGADFDVILMDIQMPRMDGCEATRRLRQAGITLPIIALSAHAFDDDRDAALRAGMDAYLTKPLDVAALLVKLGSIRPSTSAA